MAAAEQLNNSLNIDNFVQRIKTMDGRDLQKIKAETLINLIKLIPDEGNLFSLSNKVQEIMLTMTKTQQQIMSNANDIKELKEKNASLEKSNAIHTEDIKILSADNASLKDEMEGIQQYLRINNIEISGLGEPNTDEEGDDETVEDMVVQCLNSLCQMDDRPFTSDDIDICHELPTRAGRKNHIVKFVRRKEKQRVITLKKKERTASSNFVIKMYL